MAGVVLLVIVAVVIMLRSPEVPAQRGAARRSAPGLDHNPPAQAATGFPRRVLPRRAVDLVPGTWESSPQDDPLNPMQFPNALLHNVTGPIVQQFPASRVQTYTVPYTAQFHNPMSADSQMSYNDSRAEGTRAMVQAMTDMNNKCPLTSYVLIGFSQGAVIAGDVASDIGNGRGPVDDDLVLGVTLIADGRRQQGVGNEIGPNPPGEGAEITLHEVPMLAGLGLDHDRRAAGRFRRAERQDQRDLRPG